MGLGKLNYVNRKSEGVKLGRIVAKDVRKKAEKHESDRKSTALDICITGKALTDEGVAAMADGLMEALSARWSDGTPRLVLKELELASNDLTVRCLPQLAKVIKTAASHLNLLDLSSNNIAVRTQEEADCWREFLQAFKAANQMRRLILSKNNFSGPAAMEILAQIYSQHPHVIQDDVQTSTGTKTKDLQDKSNGTTWKHSLQANNSEHSNSGLRSIPYIILSEVQLEDVSALWLSYCLEAHQLPHQMFCISSIGAVEAAVLNAYKDSIPDCDGIIYRPYLALPPNGQRILNAAERSRNTIEEEGRAPNDDSFSSESSDATQSLSVPHSQRDSSSDYGAMEHGARRKSSVYATDLDSLRKKLQRTAMENRGYRRVELWATALNMVTLSRIILSSQSPRKSLGINRIPTRSGNIGLQSMDIQLPNLKATRRPMEKVPWPPSSPVWKAMLDGRKYNDANTTGKLLPTTWRQIIRQVSDPRLILNDEQISRTIAFGSDKKTLAVEREAQAKGETHQIWHLLEATECLTYKIVA